MKKHNMDELLRLLSDYHSFCRQDDDGIIDLRGYGCELNEDELDMIAAAAYMPERPDDKDKRL